MLQRFVREGRELRGIGQLDLRDTRRRMKHRRLPIADLSRSSTSTSPAASTARLDVTMTFAWIMRSMPAMPMAERSPPIVVGIKHTRNATSTVIVTGEPTPACFTLKSEKGRSVTVTRRKMIVSAASRMSSVISFGVFFRLAPSNIAIMRSRNVLPGSAVTRTTIQSRQDRRAALDRVAIAAALAGYGSLVHRGHALHDFSVDRDVVVLDEHEVPVSKLGRADGRDRRRGGLPRASSPTRHVALFRSESACAPPRPSAIASAKFAKSTVNQSHQRDGKDGPGGSFASP